MLTGSGRAVAVLTALLLVTGWAIDYPEIVALGIAGAVALAVACGADPRSSRCGRSSRRVSPRVKVRAASSR